MASITRDDAAVTSGPPANVSVWSRCKGWLRRIGLALAGLFVFYALFLLLGFIPVNRDYRFPPTDDRVRLLVRSNEIHTDIVLPVGHEELDIDWRTLFPPQHFDADVSRCPFIAIGWGSRRFFMETPTWADFKLSTAAEALFTPSQSVLHVEYLAAVTPGPTMREVYVTRKDYAALARFIRDSISTVESGGSARPAGEVSYGPGDRFYESGGRYHCFNTCNQWTGRGLATAGVPVGIWTPLKPQVLCWLPSVEQDSQ